MCLYASCFKVQISLILLQSFTPAHFLVPSCRCALLPRALPCGSVTIPCSRCPACQMLQMEAMLLTMTRLCLRCCLYAARMCWALLSRRLSQAASESTSVRLCSTRHSVLGPAVFEASHELLHVEGDRLHAVCASNAGKSLVLVRTSRHSSQLFESAEEHHSVPAACQAGAVQPERQLQQHAGPHLCNRAAF